MKLEKVSQYLLIGYFILILSIKPISLILFWLITIFGLYWMIKEKLNPFKIDTIKISSSILLLLFLSMALSVLVSNMPTNTIGHLDRILYLLFAPITAIAIYKINLSFKKFMIAVKLSVILSGIIVITQAVMKDFNFYRLSGMYNANTFGDIVTLLTMLSLTMITKENIKNIILTIFTLVMGIIAIVFSGSRGAMITFALLLLIFFLINIIYSKQAKKIIVAVLFLSMVSIYFVYKQDKSLISRFNIVSEQIDNWKSGKSRTNPVGARLEMYTSGIKAFKDSPIFGYGYQECGVIAAQYATQTKKVQKDFEGRWHLHNEFLTASVNAGIFGFIALLILYLVPLIIFIKNLRSSYIARAGFVFVSGMIFTGITHTMIGYEYETSLIVIVFIYFILKVKEESSFSLSSTHQSK